MSEQGSERSVAVAIMEKKGLLVGAAAILVLVLVATWWLLKPSYAVLLSDLPDEGQADVLAMLMEAKVPYRIDEGSGSVLVPADQLSSLRAQLSTQGLLAERRSGLELFSQGDYGMSEFAQSINYQRALQGELERTIQTIEEVRQARVHITLGKNSIFENRREPAKASVALQLKPDRVLTQRQVNGIRLLVAAAVPALETEQVVVLDEMGRSLAAGDEATDGDRWASVRQLEQDYENRARALIAGVLPDAQFRLSVKLDVNFDKKKSVKESVVPVSGTQSGYLAKRREQTSSNQTGSSEGATGSQNNSNTESEYVFGREHSEIEHAIGTIERVSVGIVASELMPAPKVAVIRDVVFSGLGMDADRGDNLAITGVPRGAGTGRIAAAKGGNDAPASDAAPTRSVWTLTTPRIVGLLVLLGFAALALLASFRIQRPSVPRPLLTAPERERLLQDVRQWLASDARRD